ncbi:helicase SNF2 [Variovorax sp. DT-64]|uniref:helicase SNF2 n=1 Tax=Variovorax sp. DT-64 TaxID=3396160 RepID=UPI003F1BC4B8
MKTSSYIATSAFSLFAAVGVLVSAGAQAETYQGVHAPVSANSRADIRAQAVIAAHSENPYAEGASSRVAPRLIASTDRATVRAEAVASAHSANPYAEGYGQGVASVPVGTVDRAALRAQARAAARSQHLPL